MKTGTAWLLIALLVGSFPAAARINLVALPPRDRIEIQLENGAYTLVEEERIVPLLQSTGAMGNNRIDFSWSNAAVHKDSIQFRPIAIRVGDTFRPVRRIRAADGTLTDEIAVINVSYPPNENALVWEIFAAAGYAAKVRVSYLIQNLTRTFNYKAVANNDETRLVLRKYLQLRNYSGEEFDAARVWIGYGEKQKELREVGQQEEIKLLMYRFADVPIAKTYTFDWYTHGKLDDEKPFASKILMHYRLTNNAANNLGLLPLEAGKVRMFIEDRRGGEAFLGEDWAKLTPIGERMRLFVGQSRDVVCERVVEFKKKHGVQGNLFNREVVLRYELQNFKDEPVTVDIVEQLNKLGPEFGGGVHGEAEWTREPKTSDEVTFSYEYGHARPVLHVKLPARPADDKEVEKKVVRFHVTIRNMW